MNRSLRHSPLSGWLLTASGFFNATRPLPKTKVAKPSFSRRCLSLGVALSPLAACVHYRFITAGLIGCPDYIYDNREELLKGLKSLWTSIIGRKIISVLVRSPFRRDALKLINSSVTLPFNTGCVIAICHTPWKRLLVEWCLENDFALIVAAGEWTPKKRRIQVRGNGLGDLRDITRHLRHNGRLIIAFDMFNDLYDCPIDFLGNRANVSLLPARLAKMAQVPLISVVPTLRDGFIQIGYARQFDVNDVKGDPAAIMQKILLSFEDELRNDPGIWPAGYGDSLGLKRPASQLHKEIACFAE